MMTPEPEPELAGWAQPVWFSDLRAQTQSFTRMPRRLESSTGSSYPNLTCRYDLHLASIRRRFCSTGQCDSESLLMTAVMEGMTCAQASLPPSSCGDRLQGEGELT